MTPSYKTNIAISGIAPVAGAIFRMLADAEARKQDKEEEEKAASIFQAWQEGLQSPKQLQPKPIGAEMPGTSPYEMDWRQGQPRDPGYADYARLIADMRGSKHAEPYLQAGKTLVGGGMEKEAIRQKEAKEAESRQSEVSRMMLNELLKNYDVDPEQLGTLFEAYAAGKPIPTTTTETEYYDEPRGGPVSMDEGGRPILETETKERKVTKPIFKKRDEKPARATWKPIYDRNNQVIGEELVDIYGNVLDERYGTTATPNARSGKVRVGGGSRSSGRAMTVAKQQEYEKKKGLRDMAERELHALEKQKGKKNESFMVDKKLDEKIASARNRYEKARNEVQSMDAVYGTNPGSASAKPQAKGAGF